VRRPHNPPGLLALPPSYCPNQGMGSFQPNKQEMGRCCQWLLAKPHRSRRREKGVDVAAAGGRKENIFGPVGVGARTWTGPNDERSGIPKQAVDFQFLLIPTLRKTSGGQAAGSSDWRANIRTLPRFFIWPVLHRGSLSAAHPLALASPRVMQQGEAAAKPRAPTLGWLLQVRRR